MQFSLQGLLIKMAPKQLFSELYEFKPENAKPHVVRKSDDIYDATYPRVSPLQRK